MVQTQTQNRGEMRKKHARIELGRNAVRANYCPKSNTISEDVAPHLGQNTTI